MAYPGRDELQRRSPFWHGPPRHTPRCNLAATVHDRTHLTHYLGTSKPMCPTSILPCNGGVAVLRTDDTTQIHFWIAPRRHAYFTNRLPTSPTQVAELASAHDEALPLSICRATHRCWPGSQPASEVVGFTVPFFRGGNTQVVGRCSRCLCSSSNAYHRY
jgi:hypothetical protein